MFPAASHSRQISRSLNRRHSYDLTGSTGPRTPSRRSHCASSHSRIEKRHSSACPNACLITSFAALARGAKHISLSFRRAAVRHSRRGAIGSPAAAWTCIKSAGVGTFASEDTRVQSLAYAPWRRGPSDLVERLEERVRGACPQVVALFIKPPRPGRFRELHLRRFGGRTRLRRRPGDGAHHSSGPPVARGQGGRRRRDGAG